ncbi:lamin tail domain-containing protein [Streptomyces sp. NBC_01498]|uniref:lamin tail domain-containing protein n=1 Tax=Streptomyces sp. NBC_01498 TaxID=2975870 RepID=UPI002E7C47B3|nr:lamin tail domain-containing protein [Streptomyces sp. NBC_01498]WTL26549.1 lamin tail domain-containing protein [Streptomyces sp. NBC_01498]
MSTVTTSGTWPSMTANPPNLEGLSTSNVRWGIPAGSGKSGYVFTGSTTDVVTDGTEFVIGTFTHQNFPIQSNGVNRFEVDLSVGVAFEAGLSKNFSFRFRHNETPNDGPNPEDIVDLPTTVSPETVTIDGTEYAVVITGFKQGGNIVTQFISAENGANSGDIVAVLARTGAPDIAITTVRYKGDVKYTQADEYVEIINRGTAPGDISGFVLGADDRGQDFTFPPGTVLQPGRRIRVYTNEVHPEWGGFNYGSGRPIWNDKGDSAALVDPAGNRVSTYGYGTAARP